MLVCDISLKRDEFELKMAFEHNGAGVVGLFGPSGCGKTSFLRALAGLEPATKGRIVVAGQTWQDDRAGINLPPWKRRLGLVFQEHRLFPHLNVKNNLLFASKVRRLSKAQYSWPEVLELLDLQTLLERKPGQLSGGESGRVAIGRALLSDPDILLFDEPLSGLDAPRRAAILPYLERLHEQTRIPMLYISHQMSEMLRLTDRMLMLSAGNITADGVTLELAYQLDTNLLSILEVELLHWDQQSCIASVQSGADVLRIWSPQRPTSKHFRVLVDARQVVLATQLLEHSSLLNQLACKVEKVIPGDDGLCLLNLVGQGWKLKSQISLLSLQNFGLIVGDKVYAGVKAVILKGN